MSPADHLVPVREAVVATVEQHDDVLAAWECGSRSFERSDEGSDLDVCVLVEHPTSAPSVLDTIERALRDLPGGDELAIWDVGADGWMGLLQRFWQGRGEPGPGVLPMVDVAVVTRASEGGEHDWRRWLEPERHGRAHPLHDPHGLLAERLQGAAIDLDAHRERMRAAARLVEQRRWLFAHFVEKELRRGRTIDAHASHRAHVVLPLVTMLGILHRPLRYDFGLRYLHEDLPPDVVARLERIMLPGPDHEALRAATAEGHAWLDELCGQVDVDLVDLEAEAAAARAALTAVPAPAG